MIEIKIMYGEDFRYLVNGIYDVYHLDTIEEVQLVVAIELKQHSESRQK